MPAGGGTLDIQAVLQEYFGYSKFREGQQQMVDAVLAGQDAVGIMPTGAGKSLCYQIPALLLDGVTLVVSPLISLMKDQVNALTQNGVPAAFLNSSLTALQSRKVLENARGGMYKILYVAPERLFAPGFLEFAETASIPFLAVDEAHCISQWGQDFRPSYLRVADFIHSLPRRPVVGAFTATATERVREDMIHLLGLHNPCVVSTGFDRPNLSYEVQFPANKLTVLRQFLAARPGKSGIVYCLTRKNVESVCASLQGLGYTATRYHAGLPAAERQKNQDDFLVDDATIMVATNAFGMGIDKSNVNFVVHYNMPKNIESYYQEAGRAGRDGLPASCLLLYSGQDVITNQFFIDNNTGANEEMDSAAATEFQNCERERLRQMTFYCHTQGCLRAFILRYFGEDAPDHCGNCHNCLHGFEQTDITVEAQKILSCVHRMGERYGAGMVADVLRGKKNDRIIQWGLDILSTYGIMESTSDAHLREMIRFLSMEGYLAASEGQYPTLRLTGKAKEILFEGATLSMGLSKPRAKPPRGTKGGKKALHANVEDPDLFERLRALRADLARRQNVPAYVVFSDSTLRAMSDAVPLNLGDLAEISGVGEVKLRRYGDSFLALLRDYVENSSADGGALTTENTPDA